MTDREHNIDWSRTSWEGSRREQVRRWLQMSIGERLKAWDELMEQTDRIAAAGKKSRIKKPRSSNGASSVGEEGGRYDASAPEEKYELALSGCNPTPLSGYLKALGILRLVAEQADGQVRGYWKNECYFLESRLSPSELKRFFLEEYQPTPIVAPWNGGSGVFPKDNRSGIDPIQSGETPRLENYRETVLVCQSVLHRKAIDEKPSGSAKMDLLASLRAELPDSALAWLDAAVLLGEDNPKFPPLLGTGGNDGRLDFTNNFMQRLVSLIDPEDGSTLPQAGSWLEEALFSSPTPGMTKAAIGQFAPGEAGGANQGSSFSADALINPWDYVLMLEGALLFAAAATRRLETGTQGALSYPFTVQSVGSGAGAAALGDEADARAEIWVPLWEMPCSLAELQSLLSEGRVTLGRKPARDGLDFVRAVGRLGVERGISGFQRYAFLKRSGKAYLATPLNRVQARRNPAVNLLDELDASNWLSLFRRAARRDQAPRSLQGLARRLEDAIFDFAQSRDDFTPQVQRILICLGEIELYCARSPALRGVVPPVPSLSPQWWTLASDGDTSVELAIAAALAGINAVRGQGTESRQWVLPMRVHLAPEDGGRYPRWNEHPGHSVTWASTSLDANLVNTLQRRLLEAEQKQLPDKPVHASRTAPLEAIAAWLAGGVDEHRIAALLPGLALVRLPAGTASSGERKEPLLAAYRLLKPFFCTDEQLVRSGLVDSGTSLPLSSELVRALASNDVAGAVRQAERRLRIAGLSVRYPGLTATASDGRHLLSVLMTPISDYALRGLMPRDDTRSPIAETMNQGEK